MSRVLRSKREWIIKTTKIAYFFVDDENNYIKKIKYFVKCQHESCFAIENGVGD